MSRPTQFEIRGLFGNKNVSFVIDGDALVLVGPNGVGKSSVINIFYFFVSRQWDRLLQYSFEEVAVWIGKTEIRAVRSDISGLSDYLKVLDTLPPTSRTAIWFERLQEHGLLEEFLRSRRMAAPQRERFAQLLGVPADEIRMLQMSLYRRFAAGEEDLFSRPRSAIERALGEHFPNRTLYLPTYRRIEKDLRDIFPQFEERLRVEMHGRNLSSFARSATHYIDLVSFGMEDVKANIDTKARRLRDYSLQQYNDLSALYLRDVIKGTADQFSPTQIETLTEESLSTILGRVSEQVLSSEDKNFLREKIAGIKGKKRSDLAVNDLYLAHYFTRLMSASADISNQEAEILAFVDVCNAYLSPEKRVVYDETKFSVSIVDVTNRTIDLSMLSSGEKQVVSLFSHLYLDEARDQIVIIDEPELSLSVPWQKRFLPDILDSGHCSFVMAVTHSPFIYQNRLEASALDLRRRTTNVPSV